MAVKLRLAWLFGLVVAGLFVTTCWGQSCGFQCDNGRCIPYSWRCDGANDCGDDSDEDGCCYSYEFQCDNGECVPDSYHCDGTEDCADGSDEDGCVNVGLIVGISVGVFVLLILIGVPCCILIIIVVVSTRKRRHTPVTRRTVASVAPPPATVVATTQTQQHVQGPGTTGYYPAPAKFNPPPPYLGAHSTGYIPPEVPSAVYPPPTHPQQQPYPPQELPGFPPQQPYAPNAAP